MRLPRWLPLPWRRDVRADVRPDRAATTRERVAAEERLERDREHVIIPLRELRAANHIGPDLSELIRKRVRRETGEQQ